MTWTAISSTDTDVDSPITVSLMAGIVNNFAAMANGDAGAPPIKNAALAGLPWVSSNYTAGSVGQAAIATGAIGQSEVATGAIGQSEVATGAIGQSEAKTSASSISTNSTEALLSLPGGQYGFYPQIRNTLSSARSTNISLGPLTASFVAWIYIGANDGTTYAQQRYFTASAPYAINEADGEVGRFVFVEIHKTTKEIISVYNANEAPWHYNGPTDIRGKAVKDAHGNTIKTRKRKVMTDIPFTLKEAILDPVKFEEYKAAFASAEIIEEEITQELKNRDMPLIPRPMEPSVDTEVILLNPLCDDMWKLAELCENHDEFDLNGMLHDGKFKINNAELNITTPPGVSAFDFSLK